jgi:hypothetical protein
MMMVVVVVMMVMVVVVMGFSCKNVGIGFGLVG